MRKTDNRNLIVVDTFDEFAHATKDMDFFVEDLVAYVTSLSQVFYWLNVESVWGRLGFVWDAIVDNKGYGHFVHTTIPFTVIPSLPDGERITKLDDTFTSITTENLIVLKSNWENVDVATNLTKAGQRLEIDLTSAPLENNAGSNIVLMPGPSGGAVLYIKGDFSNIEIPSGKSFQVSGYLNSGQTINVLEIDDNNLHLNLPTSVNQNTSFAINDYIIEYKGTAPFQEELVWQDSVWNSNFTGISNGSIKVYSNNKKYILKDHHVKIQLRNSGGDTSDYNNVLSELTVDCRDFRSNVTDIINFFPTTFNDAMKPIKFLGEVTAIDSYNPYVMIEDEWPELNAEIFSKLSPTGYIIYNPKFNRYLTACPYVIDATSFTSLYIKMSSTGHTAETTNEERIEKTNYDATLSTIDVLPTFTNIHAFDVIRFELPSTITLNSSTRIYNVIKNNFEAEQIIFSGNIYVPENIKLTTRRLFYDDYIKIYDGSVPCIHFKTIDNTQGYVLNGSLAFTTVVKSTGKANYLSFESLDDGILAKSTLNTFASLESGYIEFSIPFILAGTGTFTLNSTTINYYTKVSGTVFNPSYIYVSNKYSLDFTIPQSSQSDSGNTFWTYGTIKSIIDNIKNDTEGGATMTLKQWIFEQLTQAEKNHIIQDLNYTLIEQI